MKKGVILIIVILISNIVFAQSIVDTSKMWRDRIIGFECNSTPYSERYTETIKFEGDTVIDFVQYKKVLRATDEFYSQWEYYMLIREDIDGKVFFRTDTSQQDYLLYDFNPNINDTITVYSIFDYTYINGEFGIVSNTIRIDSIDNVFIAGMSRQRICISANNSTEEEYWVEGIGNIERGILHNKMGVFNSITQELLCVYQSDTAMYINPDINICYDFYECETGVDNISENNSIIVYPNPVTSISTITINSNKKNNIIEIYDNKGQLLIRTIVDNKFVINRNNFENGMYFYLVKNNEYILGKGKVIVK